MKPAVTVIVRYGSTNIARAGKGKDACTASSTSDPFSAALAAARKYFGKRTSVSLVWKDHGDNGRPMEFVAMPGHIMTTVELEDRGQDFWRWVINHIGEVVDCAPLQGWCWEKCRVTNLADLAVGVRPKFVDGDGVERTLSYPIVKLKKGGAR